MTVADGSWDSVEWEKYCCLLLRLRHGDAFRPVPDKSGGDGGLEGFVASGTAWQCYAPENEPLKVKVRHSLHVDKITRDLKKLETYRVRVQQILGPTILKHWVLLTPKNESADLIDHCHNKAAEAVGWTLPFISPDLCVSVQTLEDFALEHRRAQEVGLTPMSLRAAIQRATSTKAGELFSKATSPLITVMDDKLSKVIPLSSSRDHYRGELLSSQVAGEDLIGRYQTRVPDIAEAIRHEIGQAKRQMLMQQSLGRGGQAHLNSVIDDVRERVAGVASGMPKTNAEAVAEGAVAAWLQECTMDFPDSQSQTSHE